MQKINKIFKNSLKGRQLPNYSLWFQIKALINYDSRLSFKYFKQNLSTKEFCCQTELDCKTNRFEIHSHQAQNNHDNFSFQNCH